MLPTVIPATDTIIITTGQSFLYYPSGYDPAVRAKHAEPNPDFGRRLVQSPQADDGDSTASHRRTHFQGGRQTIRGNRWRSRINPVPMAGSVSQNRTTYGATRWK